MRVLLTGGTGYIGSHTAVELLNSGADVVIADALYNSDAGVIDRIEQITGRRPDFFQTDVTDRAALEPVFRAGPVDAVIHFAGFKAVGDSMAQPLEYYRNNLDATLTLLETMQAYGCRVIVFSSSATVYGASGEIPYREEKTPLGCVNPYGWTKFMSEQILRDAAAADPALSVVLLRYFNPIGAHPSGLIGEKPSGTPNNLMPYLTQVAAGLREKLYIFGDDYPTPDGTGVRDYIHVVDLAKGHQAALDYALTHPGCQAVNLGSGTGYSVLDIVHAFEGATGIPIPYEIAPRRAGDIPMFYADTEKAERLLGWTAEKNLLDMCRDAWRWQQNDQNQ